MSTYLRGGGSIITDTW